MWMQQFKQGKMLNEQSLQYFIRNVLLIEQNKSTHDELKADILDICRIFKAIQVTNSKAKEQIQKLIDQLQMLYMHLEKEAGYLERVFYMHQTLIERSICRIMGIDLAYYEEFCEAEYPRLGDMLSM